MSDKSDSYEGPSHRAPYPLSRLSAPFELVRMAEEIESADAVLRSVAGGKLEVIAEQIRALQAQAGRVLEQAQQDARLHRAQCQFKKRPGTVYHLYRRPDDTLYLSMLSPADWRGQPPHAYEGSFRLEADMSWTPQDAIAERDLRYSEVKRLLGE